MNSPSIAPGPKLSNPSASSPQTKSNKRLLRSTRSRRAQSDPSWVESFGADAEDVHHFVEKALVEDLGPLGWKLHTGRSRNELVATDFRLFVMDAAAQAKHGVLALVQALLAQAKAKLGVPMAGMTHLQHAQPILLSHFLLAHAEA